MTVVETLKRLLRRSIAATCLAYIADDCLWALRLAFGRNETTCGTTHHGLDLGASLAIIEKTYDYYRQMTGMNHFYGRVAELGPGDSLGVSLLLASRGAEVWAVDRYRSRRDSAQEFVIYESLAQRHGLKRSAGAAAMEQVHYVAGKSAEEFFIESDLRFDAILSTAVVEHLYEPMAALDAMVAALRPGGWVVHVIDLRDHGMFAGWPPLTFLRIAEPIYRRMTRYSGRPNRCRYHDYSRWLEQSRLQNARLLVTCLIDGWSPPQPIPLGQISDVELKPALADVSAIRSKLAVKFRAHIDREVAVAGCVLVARKPL